MKGKKRVISVLLIMTLVIGILLSGCGGEKAPDESKEGEGWQ